MTEQPDRLAAARLYLDLAHVALADDSTAEARAYIDAALSCLDAAPTHDVLPEVTC